MVASFTNLKQRKGPLWSLRKSLATTAKDSAQSQVQVQKMEMVILI